MIDNTIAIWHKLLEMKDAAGLDNILADNVVFYSPIVYAPQVGKPVAKLYLTAALYVFNNGSFKYLREIVSGNNAVLEFTTIIDGITVNGVDMIIWGADGRITEFKVMIRPLLAINLIHKIMRLEFQKQSALKLVSRIIPEAKRSGMMGEMLMRLTDNEPQVSEAKRTEICRTNYPAKQGSEPS